MRGVGRGILRGVGVRSIPPPFIATGGTITEADGYTIHTFTSSGNFEVLSGSGDVEYLVVGGGGAGAGNSGASSGGGGAGGFRDSETEGLMPLTKGTYPVVVGAGGIGTTVSNVRGQSGSPSSFNGIISLGGGGGGTGTSAPSTSSGGAGASGGGGGCNSGAGGAGTAGQGFAGATAGTEGVYPAGGGGGAGGAGGARPGYNSDGGIGKTSSISGTATDYAGGGSGAWYYATVNRLQYAGAGVGGIGFSSTPPTSAQPNTGSGGGGACSTQLAGSGGSGIVIIRYKKYSS